MIRLKVAADQSDSAAPPCIFLESTQGKAVLRFSRGDPCGDIVSCSYAEILCMLLQGLPPKGTVSGIVILPQFPE
jgi:hypothetical protein